MFKKIKYKIWHHLDKEYNLQKQEMRMIEALKKNAPVTNSQNRCENIISVTGFGYSGSGAMLDLLTEFENITVLSDADPDGSLRTKNYNNGTNELNLLRHSGGIFFLEKFFPSNNIFLHDCAVKMFIALIKEHYINNGEIFSDKFLELSNEFLNNITDVKIKTDYGAEYQPHLISVGTESFNFISKKFDNRCIYTLKNISKEEYISYAKKYIKDFFATINSKEYLAFDQMLSDLECDMEHYLQYIDNLKLIAVYRDPRDVYATAVSRNITWIPKDVDSFIKWYKKLLNPYLINKNPQYLLVRFEDLVLNYDETLKKLTEFLNIDISKHKYPKHSFNPECSKANIGIYKKYNIQNEISKIEEVLPDFIY